MKKTVHQLLKEHKAGRELALEINRFYGIVRDSVTPEEQAILYKAFQVANQYHTKAGEKL